MYKINFLFSFFLQCPKTQKTTQIVDELSHGRIHQKVSKSGGAIMISHHCSIFYEGSSTAHSAE